MYGLLLVQPLVGWAMVSAAGRPAILFGLQRNLKFEGYVAHEYSPTGDPAESLKKSVAICDV